MKKTKEAETPRVVTLRTRAGYTITLRSDCGCDLCRGHFGDDREDRRQ